MHKDLARTNVVRGQLVGVAKFITGDFVMLTEDFMTRGPNMEPNGGDKLIAPKGTKGRVVGTEPGTLDEVHVELRTVDDVVEMSRRWVQVDILTRFEPDVFDRAWLTHDYYALRAIFYSVKRLSDVGNLFDGHDELNEYTIEENNKLMEAALDRIYAIATGKEQPE